MFIIVLDTNIILDAVRCKVDLFTELQRICNFKYDIAILDKTLKELENKPNSKLALQLIQKKNIKILKTDKGYVDDLLFNLDKNYIIATNDKELKNKLKKENKPLITLRQKKYLITENVL